MSLVKSDGSAMSIWRRRCEMNCKDGRHRTFEAIPPLHGAADGRERQRASRVVERRTIPSVYRRLAIYSNEIMQRQISCIFLNPVTPILLVEFEQARQRTTTNTSV
jgi:hypothetical protein